MISQARTKCLRASALAPEKLESQEPSDTKTYKSSWILLAKLKQYPKASSQHLRNRKHEINKCLQECCAVPLQWNLFEGAIQVTQATRSLHMLDWSWWEPQLGCEKPLPLTQVWFRHHFEFMMVRFCPETSDNSWTICKQNGCDIAKTDGSILVQIVRARIAKVPSLYLEKPVLQTFAEQVKLLVHVFILRNGNISMTATSMSIDSGWWRRKGLSCECCLRQNMSGATKATLIFPNLENAGPQVAADWIKHMGLDPFCISSDKVHSFRTRLFHTLLWT